MKRTFFKIGIIVVVFLAVFISCEKNPIVDDKEIVKAIVELPERKVKVYMGASNDWHEQDNPANYSKWNYVRHTADGYYANFISMWVCFYQNKGKAPLQSCIDMRKAFIKGGVFFETSMETSVNSGANGFNNDSTDRRSLDLLINGGFKVEYTSLNYGVSEDRIKRLRTYRGTRKCLCLAAPWRYGGDIVSDNVAANAGARANILQTDGMQTDGPLGYWFNNQAGMRTGSYSLVRFVKKHNLESAVMLAPFKAKIDGYEAERDFLKVSKQCVFDHADNSAMPDIWTIWTYGSPAALALFPESEVNEQGEVFAPNTKLGVTYWLLKHLNNLPTVKALTAESTTGLQIVNDSLYNIKVSGNKSFKLVLDVSNDVQPQIELSPVVRVIPDIENKGLNLKCTIQNRDITDKMIYSGGLNFIENFRLTKSNRIKLVIEISPKNITHKNPYQLVVKSMANISNTVVNSNIVVNVVVE